jgi:hypothetical protein
MTTPSKQIVSEADARTTICDETGRSIELRRLGALDRLRLFKAIGAELAENTPYLGMAMLAASVTGIDGVPVPPPVTEGQLETLVQRLGDSGIEAIAMCLANQTNETAEHSDAGN